MAELFYTILLITIQFSVCFPGILARCNGINMSLTVYPENAIKVLHRQPLEIFCMDEEYDAENIDFGQRGNKVLSEKINGTTRRLYIENLPKGVYSYYCWNRVTNKHCTSRVVVDSVPLNVTDFACKSDNLDVLNCSWTAPKTTAINNYKLSILIHNYTTEACIPSKILRSDSYFCTWTVNSHPRYRQIDEQLFFILNTCNFFGCNEQHFTVDHFSIVKPSPVRNLEILSNGTHSVLLRWDIPNNMVDLLPNGVEHKIEYQTIKIDNKSTFRRVDTSMLPTHNKTYQFCLSDLAHAQMQYEVKIYIRPMDATSDEFWSESTNLVFYTASEILNKPPVTVAGAFEQYHHDSKRRITIYWKQLEEYEKMGTNIAYKIVAHETSENNQTLMVDDKSNHAVLESASLGPINVDIWTVNNNGLSMNCSHLYIPPEADTVALRVPTFTRLAYDNGAYKLSWVGVDNVDSYTLFWCQRNSTKVCTDKLDYTTLGAEKTNHVMRLPIENRYHFAISANKGDKTSGMVWAEGSCE